MARLPSANAHWRDSARQPRLLFVDYRATFPFMIWLFYPRWWTFWLCIAATLFFVVINFYGFSVNVFLRWIRCFIGGPRRAAIPWWQKYRSH